MRKKKKAAPKRKPTPPRKMSSHDLCMDLAAIGGFVEDEATRFKIYEAVRRLQLLEKAAVEAGLLPAQS